MMASTFFISGWLAHPMFRVGFAARKSSDVERGARYSRMRPRNASSRLAASRRPASSLLGGMNLDERRQVAPFALEARRPNFDLLAVVFAADLLCTSA